MLDARTDNPAFCDDTVASEPLARRSSASRPILIVLHQPHSTPSHVGRILALQGHSLDIRRPRFGDPLPKTLAAHDGAVIFGGPMSANDNDDFVLREIDWIGVALRENKPFLGICLGAQMLANHLGARVYRDADGHVEIGYHDIKPATNAANGVAWPSRVYQWHKEGFDLPDGATCLASADSPFACQAFRYASAVAVQFHPEISYQQINRWSGKSPQKLTQPGAQDRPSQLREHIERAPAIHHWLDAMLWQWKAVSVA
jgi:GMP synthase (glutamine-hydrolysing)